MAKFLVTGIAGFIGSALARALLQRGDRVRGIDNFATGKPENIEEIRSGIDFRNIDLLDSVAVDEACQGIDYVLHEAAIPSVPKSVIDPQTTNRANVDGTLTLLQAARKAKVKRVVYAASSSAYGNAAVLPKHEGMAPNPISPYAVSKLAGEMYMTSFWRVYGLETVSLRYFNIFGPRQDANSQYSAVLAKFITLMLNGGEPTIYGDGEQSRDFTYIDNCVEANLLACAAPAEQVAGEVFNVAAGAAFSLKRTVEILRKLTGYGGPVRFAQERAGDVKHSLADVSRAGARLGYRPSVDFEEGLKRTVQWYRTKASVAAVP